MKYRIILSAFVTINLILSLACSVTPSAPKEIAPDLVKVAPEPDVSAGHFQMTLFDVRIPSNRLTSFDVQAIAEKTKTTAEFEKSLQKLGNTNLLYRLDQSVSMEDRTTAHLGGDIAIPFYQNLSGGQKRLSYQYMKAGAMFQLAPIDQNDNVGKGHQLQIDLSTMHEMAQEKEKENASKMYRTSTIELSGLIQGAKPCVVANLDATTKDKNGMVIAYVCRAVLTPTK